MSSYRVVIEAIDLRRILHIDGEPGRHMAELAFRSARGLFSLIILAPAMYERH